MKRNLFLLTFIVFNAVVTNAQLSGYLKEGFEGADFPPYGWKTYNLKGGAEWIQSTLANSGNHSAFISFDFVTGKDWLVMPEFTVASGDSLAFWLAPRYVNFPPDSLVVKVSTNGPGLENFTTSLLTLTDGTNYPTTQFQFKRYSVDLSAYAGQNIYLAFYHRDHNGDGVFIDDVELGTPPPKNIQTVAINTASLLVSGTSITPVATFKNVGSKTHTFNVVMNAPDYSSTKVITALQPGNSVQVEFDAYTVPEPGKYTFRAISQLEDDVDITNDTVMERFQTFHGFTNNGWITKAPMDKAKWAMGSTSYTVQNGSDETAYITCIGGATAHFTFDNTVVQYNSATNSWKNLQKLKSPDVGRLHGHAFQYDGKIFYIGGYNPNFSPIAEISVYDIATNQWSMGSKMLHKVGDYASGVYDDSLVYIIAGYTGNADSKYVQIYDMKNDTWTDATKFPGVAAGGIRAGIADNKIVVVGGYSQNQGSELSQAWMGTIDETNPASITWQQIDDYPGGTIGRHAGTGVPNNTESVVYFTGGDPSGQGLETATGTWAYDVANNEWKLGPPKPTGVSNIVDFAPVYYNDSVFLASVGGYTGSDVTKANEWLVLGAAATLVKNKMIEFAGTLNNGKTLLNWKTYENGSVRSYVIQRSADGRNFTDLTSVSASKMIKAHNYNSIDYLPVKGVNYYRIKIVDKNSNVSYSQIRKINNAGDNVQTYASSVYPNPSHGLVNVSLQNNADKNSSVIIRITDLYGKVLSSDIKNVRGSLTVTYTLRAGNYIVQTYTADGKWKQEQKLIVQ